MERRKSQQNIQVSQESINELKKQSILFEESSTRLTQRDKELYKMIENAIRKKDKLRANMFANELTKVRHLKKVFSQCQLVMECITIRMENLLELHNVIQLEPISEVIKEVVMDIQGISPEFISGLENLSKLASDTLKQTTISFQQPVLEDVFNANSSESIQILEEVSNNIENCLQESFPEPPITTPPLIEKQTEAIEYSYDPNYKPKKASIEQNVNNITTISDDLLKLFDSVNIKNRIKLEENLT
ncbi:hypothetical protein JW865_02530 [Candidatus Bathyarchaeota archaeon]|nr:hypothetical protein [Candidatus Bathyarchaeota archaeon]